MSNIKIGSLSIPASEYGSQGNAILGIRDSGKTYTATLIAEQLHDAGIPFIVFDPIGVWRYLRVPGKGKGYPIVVAGGADGDLPLTVESAPEIVRAAMKNGVSLVIDLFDINLSKADWKRIVTQSVKVLLHENQAHGLRHIFIEEAAEFAPQRPGPDQSHVYAEMEKLARMGGNSRLGYTLINQRSEEVSKAVLELCDSLLLHRQKGKNSLNSLSKWLDVGNVKEVKNIISTLSTLEQGKCWAWLAGMEEPVLVKVQQKNSFSPNRRTMRGEETIKGKQAVDVKKFVAGMSESLTKIIADAEQKDPEKLRRKISLLEKEARQRATEGGSVSKTQLREEYQRGWGEALLSEEGNKIFIRGKIEGYTLGCKDAVEEVREKLQHEFGIVFNNVMKKLVSPEGVKASVGANKPYKKGDKISFVATAVNTGAVPVRNANGVDKLAPALKNLTVTRTSDDVSGPEGRVLSSLGFWKSIGHDQPSREQVSAIAGYTVTGSSFVKAVSSLKTRGVIDIPVPGSLNLQPDAPQQSMDADEAKRKLLSIMDGPKNRVLSAFNDDAALTREDVAAAAEYGVTGSSYVKAVSALCVLNILEKPSPGKLKLSDWAYQVLHG